MNYISSKDDLSRGTFQSPETAGSDRSKSDLLGAANQAGRKVLSLAHSARDGVTHATGSVTKEIRNNPVQASLVALGVGYIIGMLSRR